MNLSIILKPSQIENESLASAVRAQFDDEFEACRLALSTAATAYCEAAIPAVATTSRLVEDDWDE